MPVPLIAAGGGALAGAALRYILPTAMSFGIPYAFDALKERYSRPSSQADGDSFASRFGSWTDPKPVQSMPAVQRAFAQMQTPQSLPPMQVQEQPQAPVPMPTPRPQYAPAPVAAEPQPDAMSFWQRNAAMMRDPDTGAFIDPSAARRAIGSFR